MLASLRLRFVRHALVIMLMILSAIVAVQRAQTVVNGVEHALAIEHVAPTSAPVLALAAADHDHDDAAPHDAAAHDAGERDAAGTGGQDHAPGPHHHHSENSQVAALISPVTVEAAVSRSDAKFALADSGSPQSRIFGLERPPKALGDQA